MQPIKWRADELLESASREPGEFAEVLKRTLVSDFDPVFRYLKSQKLVLRRRSSAWVAALEVALERWLSDAPLKGKQKAQLKRHLQASKAIQQLLDSVDQRSSELRIWQASTETLLLALFGWIQEHENKCDRLRPASDFTDQVAALTFMEYQRKALRYACDYVVRIVNQISWRGVRDVGTVELKPSDIEEALALASLDDLVLHTFDCYTYKNYRLSVKGKDIELHAVRSEVENAGTWSALRSGSRSLGHVAGSPVRIEDTLKLARKFSVASNSFAEFLASDAGKEIFVHVDAFCKSQAGMMRDEVEELIDLTFRLRTRAGVFRVEQLLDAWSFLYRIALCAHVWRAAYDKTTVPVLPASALCALMKQTLGIEDEATEMLLAQFSLTPGERNQDPFFRPLIRLNARDLLVAGAFVETGRFSRNLFTIAIREGRVDFAAKGLKPLQSLAKEFSDAGYAVLINVPIRGPQGNVTDVDIAAAKDGYLFLGQTKVLINPDTPYDDWKVHENLSKAAQQLELSLHNASYLASKLGLATGEYVVVPFLLTNVWDFTGATVCGFKVADFSYISMILRGGTIWAIKTQPYPTRQAVKVISGKYPTGEELCRLLRRSIHEQMFRKPKIESHTVQIGDWTVTIPIDAGKLPELKTESTSVEA